MLKNKNIFISLQIEKNLENDALVLNIHFDANAPNFSLDHDEIQWNPTLDEIDFVTEIVNLLASRTNQGMMKETRPPLEHEETPSVPQKSQPGDSSFEMMNESELAPHLTKTEKDEGIFIQADEKKIDEIIQRKKKGYNEEFVVESNNKSHLDRMLKQKKKKE
ncbi:MAG TPA: hypothetical protein VMT57_04750 [Candidatus Thermoplasmatota archaeon]|nr:hypothetical protein [Candidatus Thermoplasmatota archaeon]